MKIIRGLIIAVLFFYGIAPSYALTVKTAYVDTDCASPGDGTTATCSGATAPYATLAAALTGEAADLVSGDIQLDILVFGSAADSSAPSFAGFTTDATRFIRIKGHDHAEGRTTGVWDTGRYRLERAAANAVLTLDAGYVRVENIQISNTGGTGENRSGIWVSTAVHAHIVGNLIRYAGAGVDYSTSHGIYFAGVDGWEKAYIRNNTVYNFPYKGIYIKTINKENREMYIYNNTVVDCATTEGSDQYNIVVDCQDTTTETLVMRQNVAQGSPDDGDYLIANCSSTTTSKNISEDATSPNTAYRSLVVDFEDEGADDFRLDSADDAAGNCCDDMSADANMAFEDDITTTTRTGAWDAGSYEGVEGTTTTTTTTTTSTTTTTATTTTSTTMIYPYDDLACGIDSNMDGSVDQWCGLPDQDNDGYNIASVTGGYYDEQYDCNDTDPFVYPGVYTASGCSAGQYHLCQADGTFTECTADLLCEATGDGDCYYVNPQTGSDAETGLDWDHALRTLVPFCYGCAGDDCITLAAGDVVYIKEGNITTTDSNGYILYGRVDGTSDNPITVKAYPGNHVEIISSYAGPLSAAQFNLYQAGYWVIEDLTFARGYGTALNIEETDVAAYTKVRRNIFKHIRGKGNDNIAAISINTNSNNAEIYNNFIIDVQNADPESRDLQHGIMLFYGTGSNLHHNRIIGTQSAKNGSAIWQKHGVDGSGDVTFEYNIIAGWEGSSHGAISTTRYGSEIKHNLIFAPGAGIELMGDPGGPSYLDTINITYNTIFAPLGILVSGPNDYKAAGPVGVNNNIIVQTNSSYDTFAKDKMYAIFHYGLDPAYAEWITGGLFTIDNNCYYNANVSDLANAFSVFGSDNYGTTGSVEDFAGWKSTYSFDANSYSENPLLSEIGYEAESANCKTRGWRLKYNPSGTPFARMFNSRIVNWDRRRN